MGGQAHGLAFKKLMLEPTFRWMITSNHAVASPAMWWRESSVPTPDRSPSVGTRSDLDRQGNQRHSASAWCTSTSPSSRRSPSLRTSPSLPGTALEARADDWSFVLDHPPVRALLYRCSSLQLPRVAGAVHVLLPTVSCAIAASTYATANTSIFFPEHLPTVL